MRNISTGWLVAYGVGLPAVHQGLGGEKGVGQRQLGTHVLSAIQREREGFEHGTAGVCWPPSHQFFAS